jgi:hypothetical protein
MAPAEAWARLVTCVPRLRQVPHNRYRRKWSLPVASAQRMLNERAAYSMSIRIGVKEFVAMLGGAIQQVTEGERYFSQLGSVCGDGDHGITMLRAVNRLKAVLMEAKQSDLEVACGRSRMDAPWYRWWCCWAVCSWGCQKLWRERSIRLL